jgi:hypothetical protein
VAQSKLTQDVIATIKRALSAGYLQHRIAAYFDLNQGRVSEVNRGKRGAGIPPADTLPPDFPALA